MSLPICYSTSWPTGRKTVWYSIEMLVPWKKTSSLLPGLIKVVQSTVWWDQVGPTPKICVMLCPVRLCGDASVLHSSVPGVSFLYALKTFFLRTTQPTMLLKPCVSIVLFTISIYNANNEANNVENNSSIVLTHNYNNRFAFHIVTLLQFIFTKLCYNIVAYFYLN